MNRIDYEAIKQAKKNNNNKNIIFILFHKYKIRLQ